MNVALMALKNTPAQRFKWLFLVDVEGSVLYAVQNVKRKRISLVNWVEWLAFGINGLLRDVVEDECQPMRGCGATAQYTTHSQARFAVKIDMLSRATG